MHTHKAAIFFLLYMISRVAFAAPSVEQLREQVRATETAFARSMADRDLKTFSNFIASEAIFMSGGSPLRGRDAVVNTWKKYFDKPDAPFSWKPERIEVLESGQLASSSGPVFDSSGKKIAEFSSIWRLDAPGVWHIVFDDGSNVCDCHNP